MVLYELSQELPRSIDQAGWGRSKDHIAIMRPLIVFSVLTVAVWLIFMEHTLAAISLACFAMILILTARSY